MKTKKICLSVFTMLLLLSGAVPLAFAADQGNKMPWIVVLDTKRSGHNDGESDEMVKGIKNIIDVSLLSTPQFATDVNVEAVSKQERKRSRKWIQISIPFKTHVSNKLKWMDGIQVKVEVFAPVALATGGGRFGVLTGEFTLAPVANVKPEKRSDSDSNNLHLAIVNDYSYHNLRVFINPYIVSRYLSLPSKKAEEVVSGMPIRVTLKYGNASFVGHSGVNKNFYSLYERALKSVYPRISFKDDLKDQLSAYLFLKYDKEPGSFVVLKDTIVPAYKTPWAWAEYDRQEHTIDEVGKEQVSAPASEQKTDVTEE